MIQIQEEGVNGSAAQYNLIKNQKTFDVSGFVSAFSFAYKPSFEPCWEKYDFSQIFLVLSGTGIYTTEQGSYPIRPGMMIYRPAGKRSIYEWTTENVSFALISFVCHSEAMQVLERPPFTLYEEESATLLDVMRTGARICEGIHGEGALMGMRLKKGVPDVVLSFIYASLERFLSMIYCRLSGITLLQDETAKVAPFMKQTQLVEDVKRYLAEHLSEQLTLAALCQHFWVSPTALMKKFRAETGKGVMEYFTDLKISEAKRRIAKSAASFTEIAAALGFSSVAYFSKVFKAKTGMTPTEYSRYASKRTASAALQTKQEKI
jgi:AraC-like DNA-binding protein